jgi:hypothetical protein
MLETREPERIGVARMLTELVHEALARKVHERRACQ